jgi:hypothetical protein
MAKSRTAGKKNITGTHRRSVKRYADGGGVGAPIGRPGFREKTGGQGVVAFNPQYRASYPGSPITSPAPASYEKAYQSVNRKHGTDKPVLAVRRQIPIPEPRPADLRSRTATVQTTKKTIAPAKETAFQRQQRMAQQKDVLAPKSASRSQGTTKAASRTTKTSTRTSQTPAQRAQAARRAERNSP